MSASNAFEENILKLILQNVDLALIGDATGLRGSTVAGSLFVALHSADPGETGDQTTSEVVYTGYARVAVVRSAAGWAVSTGATPTGDNVGAVTFPLCTGGTATATHFSVGTATSGAGSRLLSGALSASLAISNGVTPSFAAGALDVTVD